MLPFGLHHLVAVGKFRRGALLPPGLKSHGAETLPDLREPSFGVKILFRLSLPNASDLSVVLSRSEVVVQPGDLFEIFLSIKNKSKQPVNARIDHMIEPLELANYLDLVECGFLVPVTVHPDINQQYSARYLLRQGIPNPHFSQRDYIEGCKRR